MRSTGTCLLLRVCLRVLGRAQAEVPEGELVDADLRPEALDQQRMEQLLAEHLPENNVAIITRNEFTDALSAFVDKVCCPPASCLMPENFPRPEGSPC